MANHNVRSVEEIEAMLARFDAGEDGDDDPERAAIYDTLRWALGIGDDYELEQYLPDEDDDDEDGEEDNG
jgi:hypothetical protein